MIPYTQLKDQNRQTLRDIIPLAKPFTLVLEPSSRCNLKCAMCFQSLTAPNYFTAHKNDMPMDLFRVILAQMREWDGQKIKCLKLSLYGEPLLNKNFCRMLSEAKEAEIAERIETTSNVSLLTPEISEGLVRGGLDYLRVSIYSPLQDKFTAITGSPMRIDAIHQNLAVLQNIKAKLRSPTPFVAVKMLDTYGPDNEIFKQTYADVADELYLDKPHNWTTAAEKSFVTALYQERQATAADDLAAEVRAQFACAMSFYILAVRNNGDVAPCCIDYNGGANVGNIQENSLQDLWQGAAMKEFWTRQLENNKGYYESCRNCNYYRSRHYSKDNVDGVLVERLNAKTTTERGQ